MPDTLLRKHYNVSNTLAGFVLLLVLAAAGYYFYSQRPCAQPVTYRVGTIDPQFGVTSEQVQTIAEKAATLWNDAGGKPLLVYSSAGEVPINLIYDTRQQQANAALALNAQEKTDSAARAALDSQISAYKSAQASYQNALTAFQNESDAYNAQVQAANARGGASHTEYAQLSAEAARLKSEQSALNSQADALNTQAAQLKTQTDAFNAHVQSINTAAASYNASAGADFNEGEYTENSSGKAISIYEFTNNTQLLRVLAHELGHAIGLGHTTNPDSIMYPYNTSTSLALTQEDKAALAKYCEFSASSVLSLLTGHT